MEEQTFLHGASEGVDQSVQSKMNTARAGSLCNWLRQCLLQEQSKSDHLWAAGTPLWKDKWGTPGFYPCPHLRSLPSGLS